MKENKNTESTEALAKVEQSLPVVPMDVSEGALEAALAMGDLERLSPRDRLRHLAAICQTTGLNPLTSPFNYIKLDGKLTLYANKGCAEQLRKIHKVTITAIERRMEYDCYIVTTRGKTPDGREDEATAAVPAVYPEQVWSKQESRYKPHPRAGQKMTGEALANVLMKTETKSKRRLTLSICGLGMLDESEVHDIKRAAVENVMDAPSAEDDAAALNAGLLGTGEPEPELTVVEMEPDPALVPPPEQPKPPKPEPKQADFAQPAFLPQELIDRLTREIPDVAVAKALAWLVKKRLIPASATTDPDGPPPWAYLSKEMAERILGNLPGFFETIGHKV